MQPLVFVSTLFSITESILFLERNLQKVPRDFFGKLPPELISTIFRYLDVPDLVSVIEVSGKWRQVCTSDPVIRKRFQDAEKALNRIPKENRRPEKQKILRKLKRVNLKRKATSETYSAQPGSSKRPCLRF